MVNEYINRLTHDVLNKSGLREILKQEIAHIDRFENLDCLKDLKLTEIYVGNSPLFIVHYDGIATSDIYPNAREALIEKGIIQKTIFCNSNIKNAGGFHEYESIEMSLSNHLIKVILDIYNPYYKR